MDESEKTADIHREVGLQPGEGETEPAFQQLSQKERYRQQARRAASLEREGGYLKKPQVTG